MSKVYDPILCMLVEKPTRDSKVRYGEIVSDIKLIRTNRDWEEANEKINRYASGGFITEQERRDLREKLNAKRIKGVNDAHPGGEFYQLRFSSGRIEGARLPDEEVRSYAEALLKKYGEKQVTLSQKGKVIKTFIARDAGKGTAKGYELDGYLIKDNGYGFTISKNGRKVHECESEDEAERWIRNQYED